MVMCKEACLIRENLQKEALTYVASAFCVRDIQSNYAIVEA